MSKLKDKIRTFLGMEKGRDLANAKRQLKSQFNRIKKLVNEEGEHKTNGSPKPQPAKV